MPYTFSPNFFSHEWGLLKEKNSEILLHPAFRQINFSLHSFFDNFPEKDPSDYLLKIFAWTDLAMKRRPDLYINFRLWNLQEVTNQSAKNVNMLKIIGDHYKMNLDSAFDVRHRKSLPIQNRLYLHFDTEFIWPDLSLPTLGKVGTCYGLSSHIGILADGTVVPCCLDKEGTISLGHIQENSIEEILHSPKALKILSGFKKNILVEELCQKCQYIERFQNNSTMLKDDNC